MPLYDFVCQDCHQFSILLLNHTAEAFCPHCGSKQMTKQFAPFAIHHSSSKVATTAAATPHSTGEQSQGQGKSESESESESQGHIHTAACSSQCGARSQADALIKKYLK